MVADVRKWHWRQPESNSRLSK